MTGITPPPEGLTILEISSFVAALLGGLTLAQLGADVIRIDPTGGGADAGRWPPAPSDASLYWTGLNKEKKSLTLNFRDSEGQGILADLVARVRSRRRDRADQRGWEHDAHLYWRRAKTDRFLLGSAREHRAAVARLVMGGSTDA
jgi:2-methylfumaryl-CoA isomerase